MLKLVQNVRNGVLSLASIPEPLVEPGKVLIANACSVISAGTEKMVTDLARKSILAKARARPDHVRRILQKMRTEGFFATLSQVTEKLNEPISLGYSSAGLVLACGAGVQGIRPGDHVASNGPHAEVVSVPKHLCALIAPQVPLEQAAFAVIGSIALQGVRLAEAKLADSVLVIGLGLIGQIAVQLLKAHGCRVLGTDPDSAKCELATKLGADYASPNLRADRVMQLTRGIGADSVVITAATKSDGPVELAAAAVRTKGRVVAVGAVGLNLPRTPFYMKEAELIVSCSYGPGRYDPAYEGKGQDYPVGHVRWTEQRNMQAILDLLAAGRIDFSPLITHRFSIEDSQAAYQMIEKGTEPYLGILLNYPDSRRSEDRQQTQRIAPKPATTNGKFAIGCLGAGSFARLVLLPAILKTGAFHPHTLCSAGGLSAAASGKRLGFEHVTSDEDAVFGNGDVNVVFCVTRHDQHARQVIKALEAGKHVFVEKPLGLTVGEISDIEQALLSGSDTRPILMVGFNRRFAPATLEAKRFFANTSAPLTISIRFNAGEIPADHWTQDDEVGGGRIIGEACHAIDLATYLAGSPPVRVFAESIGGPDAPAITDDQCFLTLRHANGSVTSIGYLAGGDKAFSKERVEILGGGRVAVIDDFKDLITSVGGKVTKKRAWRQDKGHQAEVVAFANAVKQGGESPIPWADLRAVSLAAILAVRSLREGVPFEIPQTALDARQLESASDDCPPEANEFRS